MQISLRLIVISFVIVPACAVAFDATGKYLPLAFAGLLVLAAGTADRMDLAATMETLRRLAFAVAFPVLWLILQILPVPLSAAASIWQTAAKALEEPRSWGFISVAPGATLASLVSYLGVLALAVSTALVSRDRQRAKFAFFALLAAALFFPLILLLDRFALPAGLLPIDRRQSAAFVAGSNFSLVLGAASMVMAIERYLAKRGAGRRSVVSLLGRVSPPLVVVAIPLAALATFQPSGNFVPAGIAVLSVIFVALARAFGAKPWLTVVAFALASLCLVAATYTRLQPVTSTAFGVPTLQALQPTNSLAMRVMAGTPLLGNGVGTFEQLARVYLDFSAELPIEPPTTAALVAIEWGRPATIALIFALIQVFLLLFRGAIRRGRDSFYASAAAAGIMCLATECVLDISLLSPAIQVVTSGLLGIGLGQSIGRTGNHEN